MSTDADLKVQCEFAERVGAKYPMVIDADGAIARSYDVLWPFITVSKRVTFLLDEGQILRGIFWHEARLSAHRDQVFTALRRLKTPKHAA